MISTKIKQCFLLYFFQNSIFTKHDFNRKSLRSPASAGHLRRLVRRQLRFRGPRRKREPARGVRVREPGARKVGEGPPDGLHHAGEAEHARRAEGRRRAQGAAGLPIG